MSAPRSWERLLPWSAAFAIAMALLESAVVVYARMVYYPLGFVFPLVPIDRRIAAIEFFREVATMVMLLAPGALIAKKRTERFAWFCFCFGVWDIFYYVFLKCMIDWPMDIFSWDVLFLVPVVWVGPVLAPCIVSLGLIALAIIVLGKCRQDEAFALGWRDAALLGASAVLMLFAFMEEPCRYVIDNGSGDLFVLCGASDRTLDALRGYVPVRFAWPAFIIACGIATLVLVRLARRAPKA